MSGDTTPEQRHQMLKEGLKLLDKDDLRLVQKIVSSAKHREDSNRRSSYEFKRKD